MFLILPLVGWWGLTGMETPRQACTQDLCCYRATYNPIARRSIRPFLTGGHHRYTPVTGRVNVNSASAVPSSAPTMRLSCASKPPLNQDLACYSRVAFRLMGILDVSCPPT